MAEPSPKRKIIVWFRCLNCEKRYEAGRITSSTSLGIVFPQYLHNEIVTYTHHCETEDGKYVLGAAMFAGLEQIND